MRATTDEGRKAWLRQFGRLVADGRRQHRMTQHELGRALGLTRSSVANVEAGRQELPASRAAAVVALLGVEVPGWATDSDHWRDHAAQQARVIRDLADRLQAIRAAVEPVTATPPAAERVVA